MSNEFREFIERGNVVDLAVGVIIGSAFTSIVNSLVDDILMPPIGLLLGGVDFSNFFIVLKEGSPPGPYAALADAEASGAVSLNYGLFVNSIVSFLIVSLAIFMLVRAVNAVQRELEEAESKAAPTTKECPFCASIIPVKATRCPQCTSQLPE